MEDKDVVIEYIGNSDIDLGEIENTLMDGLKKRYCIEGLYFFYRIYNSGITINSNCSNATITFGNSGNVGIGSTSPSPNFNNITFGGATYSYPKLNHNTRLADDTCSVHCTTNKDNIHHMGVWSLGTLLKNLELGTERVYFTDLNKAYNNLHDLKHDFLAYKLAGLK